MFKFTVVLLALPPSLDAVLVERLVSLLRLPVHAVLVLVLVEGEVVVLLLLLVRGVVGDRCVSGSQPSIAHCHQTSVDLFRVRYAAGWLGCPAPLSNNSFTLRRVHDGGAGGCVPVASASFFGTIVLVSTLLLFPGGSDLVLAYCACSGSWIWEA